MAHLPGRVPRVDAPAASLVRAELERILSNPLFARSDRLSAFLSFVVEQTLGGRGDSLKEHVIAIALYGKDADFNAAGDPIVRVDARRLRDKLREVLRRAAARSGRHLRAQGQLHAGVRDGFGANPPHRRHFRRPVPAMA